MTFCDTMPRHITLVEQQLYFRDSLDPDYGLQSDEYVFECGWKFLPEPALVEIYKRVADCDRLSMARTCRRWHSVFGNSEIWRHRSFRFGGLRKYRTVVWKALKVSRAFGRHFRSMEITCDHPTRAVAGLFSHTLRKLVGVFKWKNIQLRRLSIPRLQMDRNYRNPSIKNRLSIAICRLLKMQTSLVCFDMNNAGFDALHASQILKALTSRDDFELRELNLEDFASNRLNLYDKVYFKDAIARLSHLSRLYINYSYVNDDVMRIITQTCGHCLEEFGVKIYRLEAHNHVISPACWNDLKERSPNLKANIYFEGVANSSVVQAILIPQIPVKWLQVWSGKKMYYLDWKLRDTLKYIGQNFNETIG